MKITPNVPMNSAANRWKNLCTRFHVCGGWRATHVAHERSEFYWNACSESKRDANGESIIGAVCYEITGQRR